MAPASRAKRSRADGASAWPSALSAAPRRRGAPWNQPQPCSRKCTDGRATGGAPPSARPQP
eukprot:1926694-Pyramimonas_sp.AAC.1